MARLFTEIDDILEQRSGRGLLADAWTAVEQVRQALAEPADAERLAVVGSARRGWLQPADVLNTRPLDELRALLAARREPA